jgi:hypothetical protein
MDKKQQDRKGTQNETEPPRQVERGEQSLRGQRDSDVEASDSTQREPASVRDGTGIGSSVGQERETGRRTHDSESAREAPTGESLVNNLSGAYHQRQ